MDCGSSFIKYLLFIFNFVFVLCGLALLIPGILVETNLGQFDDKLADHVYQIQWAAIALIIIGSIIFVIAFFGCCGAIRESHCMTVTYAVLLLTILVVQVAIAILAFMSLKNIDNNEVTKLVKEPVNKYWTDDASRTVVDFLQQSFLCCGADGSADYNRGNPNMNGTIPWSCCSHEKEEKYQFCNSGGDTIYKQGCGPASTQFLKMAGKGFGGIALGIAGVELVGIIFALCLANSIRNEDRRNYRV